MLEFNWYNMDRVGFVIGNLETSQSRPALVSFQLLVGAFPNRFTLPEPATDCVTLAPS